MSYNQTAYPHLYTNGSSSMCVSECPQQENCTLNCMEGRKQQPQCLTIKDTECHHYCGIDNIVDYFNWFLPQSCKNSTDKRRYPHLYSSNGTSVCVSECPPESDDVTCIFNCRPGVPFVVEDEYEAVAVEDESFNKLWILLIIFCLSFILMLYVIIIHQRYYHTLLR